MLVYGGHCRGLLGYGLAMFWRPGPGLRLGMGRAVLCRAVLYRAGVRLRLGDSQSVWKIREDRVLGEKEVSQGRRAQSDNDLG